MTSSNQFHVLNEGHVPLTDDESDQVTDLATEDEMPAFDCSHHQFVRMLDGSALPGDAHGQGAFDNRSDFVLGDPGAHFGGMNTCDYATSGAKGEPHWFVPLPDQTL